MSDNNMLAYQDSPIRAFASISLTWTQPRDHFYKNMPNLARKDGLGCHSNIQFVMKSGLMGRSHCTGPGPGQGKGINGF